MARENSCGTIQTLIPSVQELMSGSLRTCAEILERKTRMAFLSICSSPTPPAPSLSLTHTHTYRIHKSAWWRYVPEGTEAELNWNTCVWSIPTAEIAVYKYPVPNVFDPLKLGLLFQFQSSKDTVHGWVCIAFRVPGVWAILGSFCPWAISRA